MSRELLRFIKKNPLFKAKNIENNYQYWSEGELQKELEYYRDFCINNIPFERNEEVHNLSILVEGFRKFRPNETLMKQCALYVEEFIINDPLFEQTFPRDALYQAANAFVGLEGGRIDRTAVVNAVKYIKSLQKAIETDFIKFIPLSYLHEPPKEIPIYFSENLFSDVLPQELLDFFREATQVSPLYKIKDGWAVGDPKDLIPCRAIDIHFDNDTETGMIYFLTRTEVLSSDKETGIIETLQYFPDEPPDPELFHGWVFQSINKTAQAVFHSVIEELSAAHRMKANYLTNSRFVANLLSRSLPISEPNLKTEITNLVLDLELPILEGVSLDRILEIRQKDGEVFQSFRLELERKLRVLRQIDDTNKLKAELENVSYELSEMQINDINRKISTIKRKMIPDSFILVGGLATIIQAGGFGIPVLTYGLINGLKTYNSYISEVKNNPAFFLWRLKEGK